MSLSCATSSLAATRGRGGGEEQVAVAAGDRQHLRGDVLGELLGQARAVGVQHLGHALDLRGGLGRAGGVLAGDEHVNVAAALDGGGDGVERGALQGAVVVFGDDEAGHADAPVVPASRPAPQASGPTRWFGTARAARPA